MSYFSEIVKMTGDPQEQLRLNQEMDEWASLLEEDPELLARVVDAGLNEEDIGLITEDVEESHPYWSSEDVENHVGKFVAIIHAYAKEVSDE